MMVRNAGTDVKLELGELVPGAGATSEASGIDFPTVRSVRFHMRYLFSLSYGD